MTAANSDLRHPAIKALKDIEESRGFRFHPTGSRYLGLNRPNSDYDFFCGVDDSGQESLIAALELHGFKPALSNFGVYGSVSAYIMQWKPSWEGLGEHPKVDVIISGTDDIDNRMETFKALKNMVSQDFGRMQEVHKLLKGNNGLWQTLYRLYAAGWEAGALACEVEPVNSKPPPAPPWDVNDSDLDLPF